MPRLIDANELIDRLTKYTGFRGNCEDCTDIDCVDCIIENAIKNAPTVDAVEMPKGKPGDYLEWDNGAGFRQIYHINAVMICEDCMRYDLEKFAPFVNHPNIVRILSIEEAEQEWKEMCAKAVPREEPTLTACRAKMDGDGDEK